MTPSHALSFVFALTDSSFWNLPAAHFTHAVPTVAYSPAAQAAQSPIAPLPSGEDTPARQSVHTVRTASLVYFPAAHLAHKSPPADVEPAAQAVQAPTPSAEDSPAAQGLHAFLSASCVYFPAAHLAHKSPPADIEPGAQAVQSATRLFPSKEDKPAPQSVHETALRAKLLNLPAAHVVHASLLGLVAECLPASQSVQAAAEALTDPAGPCVPATQVVTPVVLHVTVPTSSANFPTAQSVHAAAPSAENWPAAHTPQSWHSVATLCRK